jgi:cytochrome c-type biogenesis protein
VNPENLSIGLAFIAGLISFISPCVLPLVPAYIGYMGGRVTNTVAAQVAAGGGGGVALRPSAATRFNTVIHGLFFVLGFTFIFVALGIVTTVLVQQIGGQNISLITDTIGRVGGLVIIFFGLHFMGVMPKIFTGLLQRRHTLLTTIIVLIVGALLILWGFVTTLETGTEAQFALSLHNTNLIIAGSTTLGGTLVAWFIPVPALVALVAFGMWLALGGAFGNPAGFWRATISGIQGLLYADTRHQMTASGQQGYLGSAVMGVVFSAGWTPCIGPVYGAVLTLAANTGNAGQAVPLLAAYSLGLGVPFLLTALLMDSAQGILRRLQRHMGKIELASGAFLVLIGVLVATGTLAELTQQFTTGDAANFSVELEENILNALTGETEDATPTPAADEGSALPALGSIEGAAAAIDAEIGLEVGNRAPNFRTTTDDGETVALADLRGQAVLLNFWATWCGPCRIEMPEFEAAYTTHAGEGFTILAVNNMETPEQVRGFRDELALSFPLLLDESGAITSEYAVVSLPSTYVLNREGIIVARHFGALTAAQMTELVSAALGG